MCVITIGSMKGGTGKTTLTLLTARRLASAGKKVLVIDSDYNDSSSFALAPDNSILKTLDPQNRKHLAAALQSDNLLDFVIPSVYENIDLIRSSLYLVDLRTLPINRLSNLLKLIPEGTYDYILIDTAPTYDNIVLNAYEGSDIIVTPVLLNQFDYRCADFLSRKLRVETSNFSNWKILVNKWNYLCDNPNSSEHDYIKLLQEKFPSQILSSHIIDTKIVKSAIDRQEEISDAQKFEKIKASINSFVSEITGIDFSNVKEKI